MKAGIIVNSTRDVMSDKGRRFATVAVRISPSGLSEEHPEPVFISLHNDERSSQVMTMTLEELRALQSTIKSALIQYDRMQIAALPKRQYT